MMATAPQYVFRGTTVNFAGSSHSQSASITSVSTHPVIALWFAKECMIKNPNTSCIYIAKTVDLSTISTEINVLASIEREIGYKVSPSDFYKLTAGYVNVQDFQAVLTAEGISCADIVRIDNLTRLCQESKKISAKRIEKIVKALGPYLK
jgi:hypothetical protein